MFDSSGRLIGVDNKNIERELEEKSKKKKRFHKSGKAYFQNSKGKKEIMNYPHYKEDADLKNSESLYFLKEQNVEKEASGSNYWNFYSDGVHLDPLKFSNGKTQEDVVKEIVDLIKGNHKIIFLHGVCGSGKSAIALNIARALGKSSVVVPLKSLQQQYEQDYSGKKYLIKENGKRMKIASITGRDNHDSLIMPGISCAHSSLPENIKISDKNLPEILKYYSDNPLINESSTPDLKDIKRMMIAPSNPYWSPILPASFEIKKLFDAEKKKYLGVNGQEFIFYHRKKGCSYYDQYLAYIYADVIIFNSAKYKAELAIGRKPETQVDIIDEADEFLDSLFHQKEINLHRLYNSLKSLSISNNNAQNAKSKIIDLLDQELQNHSSKGVDEVSVFKLTDTGLWGIFEVLLKSQDLETEITIDELNYSNKALETAKSFKETIKDVYLMYRKEEDNIFVKLVSTNLSGKIKELVEKNNALVFMSGTLHSEEVIKKILGINDFKVVEAETLNQGSIEIIRTGKEFDCRYSVFNSKEFTREDYLFSASECLKRAKPPVLIHVNAFKDLPSESEKEEFGLYDLVSSEFLIKSQKDDKTGEAVSQFKKGFSKTLFTTKCSRGLDFPGEMCNSVLFTKYPNPNINDTFWQILKKTHPEYFWKFYKDKAKREFLQRIYRAIRSAEDHIYVLSPDTRILDAVREIQLEMYEK